MSLELFMASSFKGWFQDEFGGGSLGSKNLWRRSICEACDSHCTYMQPYIYIYISIYIYIYMYNIMKILWQSHMDGWRIRHQFLNLNLYFRELPSHVWHWRLDWYRKVQLSGFITTLQLIVILFSASSDSLAMCFSIYSNLENNRTA